MRLFKLTTFLIILFVAMLTNIASSPTVSDCGRIYDLAEQNCKLGQDVGESFVTAICDTRANTECTETHCTTSCGTDQTCYDLCLLDTTPEEIATCTATYLTDTDCINVQNALVTSAYNACNDAAASVLDSCSNGFLVYVPAVIGLAQVDAQNAISGQGLISEVITINHYVTAGNVIQQVPNEYASALPGDTVRIYVSLGPVPVIVPDVVTVPTLEDDAVAAIEAVGLITGVVSTAYDAVVALDCVISQDPVGGSTALQGTTVDIVVSLGPQPIVPLVVGETIDDAILLIEAQSLNAIVTYDGDGVTTPQDIVLSQDPVGGTDAFPGNDVNITVRGVAPPATPL